MSRIPLPPEHYPAVAAAYTRIQEQHPYDTTMALARHFGVSRSTAGRWIAGARQRGLLEARPVGSFRKPRYTCPRCGWRCHGPHPKGSTE